MNIKKELGNRIKKLRLKLCLTQEELAEKINLSAKSLSQIELGNNFVSAETLEKICVALNTKPKILFDFVSTKEQKDMLSEVINKLKKDKHLLKQIYTIINIMET